MASPSLWLLFVDQWEAKVASAVKSSRAAFQLEKYSLQLHVETNPVAFRPSTVLSQLIHGEKKRGISTKQQRQRAKTVEHLERKLESEVWQHYELETAQACLKWKKLLHLLDDRRQLWERIHTEAKQLCEPLLLCLPPDDALDQLAKTVDETVEDDEEREIERQRLLVESEWTHQERFNIQEAFTNQTKKIQADYKAFLDQIDAEFIVDRQKILAQSQERFGPPVAAASDSTKRREKDKAAQFDKQFVSNAKRHMLVQTAPVVELHGGDNTSGLLTNCSKISSGQKSDLSQTDRQLQELEHRSAAYKEVAEGRLKEGMQWIARQCAQMFSQLDCKEAEAKLVLLITQQNEDGARKLLYRIAFISSQLQTCINRHTGSPLPPLPTVVPPPTAAEQSKHSKAQASHHRRTSDPVGLKGARETKVTGLSKKCK